jgi:hypothetical protein
MKIAAPFVVLAVLVAIAGCSSITVSTNFDSDADFNGFESYTWMKETETGEGYDYSGLLDERIKGAIDEQLVAKGLRKAATNPDLYVVYHAGKKERLEVEDWGYGGWWGVGGGEAYSYEQGTLIVDLIDTATKKLVWRGTAQKALSDSPSAGEREAAIDEAVQKMFKKFPPTR